LASPPTIFAAGLRPHSLGKIGEAGENVGNARADTGECLWPDSRLLIASHRAIL
jgi:hypothetical protein